MRIENTFMTAQKINYASQDALELVLTVTDEEDDDREPTVLYSSPPQIVGEGKTPSVTLECFITGL